MPSIRLLFLADTHLGYDTPLRPRVQRRRRGDDFTANYLQALQPALNREVDLVLHGGDMFFRSRVHPAIVQAAFEPLLRIADLGIPVLIVPGNHERSNIPRSLLETHPGIIIFDRPRTPVVMVRGRRLGFAGFPNLRNDPASFFRPQLEKTGWNDCEADLRLLCMHQVIEGAQVGIQNYTFRTGREVIRGRDIPHGFDAVLSGHIHRHQVLTKDPSGEKLPAPVFYPGSTERTSFAEKDEQKGYLILNLPVEGEERIHHQFVPLPSRPMIDLPVSGLGLSPDLVKETLMRQIADLDENAIVRIRIQDGDVNALIRTMNDRWLRSVSPKTMNIGWSHRWQPNRNISTNE
jgi:DNA repair protein SbcD/Mre11